VLEQWRGSPGRLSRGDNAGDAGSSLVFQLIVDLPDTNVHKLQRIES
jgi:hypothetical protein